MNITLSEIIKSTSTLIIGGFGGYFFAILKMKKQKRYENIERQIKDFYSPMLGYYKKIRSLVP